MKYLWRGGQWIDAAGAPPLHPVHRRGPMIIHDQIDPFRSTLDGRVYDSKSNYYADVKAAGCEVAGNERAYFDQQPSYQPPDVGGSIKRAIAELESR